MASSNPSYLYRQHKDACEVYEYFEKKLRTNTLEIGEIFSHLNYQQGTSNLPVIDVVNSMIATKSFSLIDQPEPVGSVTNQWVVSNNPSAPYPDYEVQYRYWKDIVNLYEECVKIFSSKIFPPYNQQRLAFQDKYYYAFQANYSACDQIIVQLSQHYSDTGLVCVDFTDYYKVN